MPLGGGGRGGGTGSGKGSGGAAGLRAVAAEAGMHVLTASDGWEADDVIGSVCSVLLPGTGLAEGTGRLQSTSWGMGAASAFCMYTCASTLEHAMRTIAARSLPSSVPWRW